VARTFGGVSTDKIAVAQHAAINNLVTQTWSVWVYRTGPGAGAFGRMFDKKNVAANGSSACRLYDADGATYTFEANRWNTAAGIWSATIASNNVWHHICVTYDASSTSNDPLIYVDGVSQTVTENQAPSGSLGSETEQLTIGNRSDGVQNWAGSLAELSCHNVVLNANEVAALARGCLPWQGRPDALAFYAPLWGIHSPEINLTKNNVSGTVTGTVRANHPPVRLSTPGSAGVMAVTEAAPPGGRTTKNTRAQPLGIALGMSRRINA
jgi:hypothetical protein